MIKNLIGILLFSLIIISSLKAEEDKVPSFDMFYLKATVNNDAAAQYNLGVMYYNGDGVTQDYLKAKEWYEKAAAQNYADAQYNLGVIYRNGEGVPQDYTKAIEWFEKAAAQGSEMAQANLGLIYASGRQGAPLDYTKAIEWFKKAAAQDEPRSQYSLGLMYEQGIGVTQDLSQAKKYYHLACNNKLQIACDAYKKIE